jgi:Na+/H+ antiporter NhaD/arsenite permease-like protein
LGGLGIVGILVSIFRTTHKHPTHLEAQIDGFLQKIDLASLLFFAGILLAVGALRHLGILADISAALFGANPELWRLILGNSVLGVLSAIVDNIPLTAAAMTIVSSTDPAIWVLLALAVGTGGSLLVIGSAAGVVAMGMVKELTFGKYLRHVTFPALVGYIVAIVIWYTQYTLLG